MADRKVIQPKVLNYLNNKIRSVETGYKRNLVSKIARSRGRLEEKARANKTVATSEKTMSSVSKAAKGPKWKMPIEAAKLAFHFRKLVSDHNNSPFLIVLLAAALTDTFEIIPVVGSIGTFSVQVFIFIFLWGKGRLKVRIIVRCLAFLEMIPGVDVLPMATIAVLYAWHSSAKEAKKAKEKMGKLNKELSKI